MECCRAFVAGIFLFFWVGLSTVSSDSFPPCEFPALYNFGDSNSDTGGISAAFDLFPALNREESSHNIAGRACDGRLIIDFIAEHLKLPYLSAYLDSLGANFRHGANFATGGSTIRRQNETIFEYGISPFSLDMQILQFNRFKAHSKHFYNNAKTASDRDKLPRQEDFAKALYIFDIGQNDLSVGFRTMSFDQLRATIPDIITQLASAVQNIYQQGGRTFWIHNVGPVGCLPFYVFSKRNSPAEYIDEHGCVKNQNDMAVEFNVQLKERVIKLKEELLEAALIYVDIYTAKYRLISNAKNLGYADPFKVCCGYHENDDHVWCGSKGTINNTEVYGTSCKDPSKFISFDGVHYSESANQWVANQILYGSLTGLQIPITQACYMQASSINYNEVSGVFASNMFEPEPESCLQFL